MGAVTIGFGVVFIALGPIGYLPHQTSLTALIPSAFGVAFVVLGVLAREPRRRMHVMHAAAMLGTLGMIGGVVMIVRALSKETINVLALTMNVLLSLGCAAYVGLCVKSFIDARRRRGQDSGLRAAERPL
jgi:hypothetical protein